MHLAECLKDEADLFAARHEDKGFALQMRSDEAEQGVELLVKLADNVVLLKTFGHVSLGIGFLSGYEDRISQRETSEVGYRLRLCRGEKECLARLRKMR